jgi:diketogulonate reductase-like aldo/keto reductase
VRTPPIPEFGLGTYDMDGETCARAVEVALDAGYRHLDTARMYGNEAAVGRGLARSGVDREDVFVATKVWHDSLAPDDLLASARASRDDLGLGALDLLYVHWPRGSYDPERTLPALASARERGLTRHVGLSNFTPALLDEAREILTSPIAAHQVEMHPLLPQADLRADAADAGHRLVAYCPIARNEIAGVPEIAAIADERGVSPAVVSLAWVLAKGAIPIPKSATPAHVRANLAARDLALTDEEVARIDGIDRRERLIDPDDAAWNGPPVG